MPRDTAWYRGLAAQIADGFSQLGLQAAQHCGPLDEAALAAWLDRHRPQLIFDMNMSRADRPTLPHDIRHACWLVDFNGRSIADFKDSELTYLFAAEWVARYPHDGFCRWLPPASCPRQYFPTHAARLDTAAFVGHIPKPWSSEELQRNISCSPKALTFEQVLPLLEDSLSRQKSQIVVQEDYKNLLSDIALRHFNVEIRYDHRLEYDLSGRLIRLLNRRELLDRLIEIDGLAIYGPDNWQQWPQYRRFYRQFLETPTEMRTVYNQSSVNFHEGCSMHFRVVDAMACAGLVFVKRNAYDEADLGLQHFFQPGVHFVEFDTDNLLDKFRYYSNNPALADKTREAAWRAINAGHCWKHRAREILDDLARV